MHTTAAVQRQSFTPPSLSPAQAQPDSPMCPRGCGGALRLEREYPFCPICGFEDYSGLNRLDYRYREIEIGPMPAGDVARQRTLKRFKGRPKTRSARRPGYLICNRCEFSATVWKMRQHVWDCWDEGGEVEVVVVAEELAPTPEPKTRRAVSGGLVCTGCGYHTSEWKMRAHVWDCQASLS